jgi:hypothetical protein
MELSQDVHVIFDATDLDAYAIQTTYCPAYVFVESGSEFFIDQGQVIFGPGDNVKDEIGV